MAHRIRIAVDGGNEHPEELERWIPVTEADWDEYAASPLIETDEARVEREQLEEDGTIGLMDSEFRTAPMNRPYGEAEAHKPLLGDYDTYVNEL